jgi:high-affinity iron transporter
MEQIIFVVWRESIEALLVVGILYSWLRQSGADGALRYLWFGVGGGVAVAILLAFALLSAQQLLTGTGQDIFMLVMMLTASALIVQMVLWMRGHGAGLQRHLKEKTREAVDHQAFWSISVLVAVAIAREGSETVVFLYGMSYAQQSMGDWASFSGAVALALALAGVTYYALQAGRYWLSWKHFFRVTEIMLLLLASALLLSAVDKMIGLGWLPAGIDPVWDTSSLLSESSRIGSIVSALTGYRAYPALTDLLVWGAFWLSIAGVFRYQRRKQEAAIA